MRRKYCVFDCDDHVRIPIHRFPHPVSRPELFAAWKLAVGDKLPQIDPMKIYKNKKICDMHFDPTQKVASRRLVWSAIPNINLKRVRRSIAAIVDIDHSYSRPRRELYLMPPTALMTHTSGPTSESLQATESLANTVEDTVKKEDGVMAENTTVAVAIDNSRDDNDNDDDVVPDNPVPESEELPQNLYSWEKADTIVADDTMIVSDFTMAGPDLTLDFGDISMYNDEQSSKGDQTGSETLDYKCNRCGEKITGFRYTCVQCVDWDLCAVCEAHVTHDTHYVLRVPGQRPYKEVQAILTAVRQQLLCENLSLTELTTSIKEELIDEDAEVPEGAPDPEGDPLGAWNISQRDDDDDDTFENNLEPNEDGHLPQNRRRVSLDSLNTIQNLTPRADSSCSSQVTETENDLIETSKDNPDLSQTEFSYSEPIEIIDIDKLTRTHEQTRQDPEQNDSDMYTDIIQITKENDIEMLAHRLDDILDTTKSKPNSDMYTDRTQITKENDIEMLADGLDDILDTTKSKPQHTEQQKLVDISSDESPLNTFKHTSHLNDETHNDQIRTQNKEIGISTTETGALSEDTETRSQTKTRMHGKRIITRSIAKTNRQTKGRYTIMLPPGDEWKQYLMTILQSRVTVQLEDVMRNMEVHKNPERNKKAEINEI